MPTLKVYVCTDHDLHYPVGCASVVVARDRRQARRLLDEQLRRRGLKGHAEEPYTLVEVDVTTPQARVLRDGDY